jgi:hypothetical protein
VRLSSLTSSGGGGIVARNWPNILQTPSSLGLSRETGSPGLQAGPVFVSLLLQLN